MTTEEDFQAALDADPDDWQSRLVFADWLQERDDPRAEGYRALGRRRHSPLTVRMGSGPWEGRTVRVYGGPRSPLPGNKRQQKRLRRCLLPQGWFGRIEPHERSDAVWQRRLTRREAEDAAALAFAELPEERRAEPLATQLGEGK